MRYIPSLLTHPTQLTSMDLTTLSNEQLGTLKAQIENEMQTRHSDSGYSEAWLETIDPPKTSTSCADNALKWDWLRYIQRHGSYVNHDEPRNMLAFEQALSLGLP
jgi:hypothetical protein